MIKKLLITVDKNGEEQEQSVELSEADQRFVTQLKGLVVVANNLYDTDTNVSIDADDVNIMWFSAVGQYWSIIANVAHVPGAYYEFTYKGPDARVDGLKLADIEALTI